MYMNPFILIRNRYVSVNIYPYQVGSSFTTCNQIQGVVSSSKTLYDPASPLQEKDPNLIPDMLGVTSMRRNYFADKFKMSVLSAAIKKQIED